MKPFLPTFRETSEEERKKLQHFELDVSTAAFILWCAFHPVSGRKVLFVNPQFTVGINGMEERESHTARPFVPPGGSPGISISSSLGAAYHRDVGQSIHQHYAVHDYYPQRRYMEA